MNPHQSSLKYSSKPSRLNTPNNVNDEEGDSKKQHMGQHCVQLCSIVMGIFMTYGNK
jgi:hypothetical protein